MRKSKITAIATVVLLFGLVASVFADSAIKLFVNGQELKPDVPPQNIEGRVLVPIRAASEALGAIVTWDAETNSVLIDSKGIEAQKSQILRLEQALAPEDQLEAAKTWAEGVKMRNGALQYAVMSPELKKETYSGFVESNWSTGVSSPWVDSYKVTEKSRIDNETYRFEVEFTYTDSTKSTFETKEYITVKNFDGNWLISSIEKVDVKGQITKLTLGDDQKVKSIFVEDKANEKGAYDKANVIIGTETKIFKGYTDEPLMANDLKEGTKVEVTFVDGPRLTIYPVSAQGKIIRVIE